MKQAVILKKVASELTFRADTVETLSLPALHFQDCRLFIIREPAKSRRQIQCGSIAGCLDMIEIRA